MSANEIQTPSSFNECMESFAETMKKSYTVNEEGQVTNLAEEQMTDIMNIIEVTKARVSECFKPLFETVEKQIEVNQKRIEQLQFSIANHKTGILSPQINEDLDLSDVDADDDVDVDGLPSAKWILSKRKNKSENAVTGYNVYTIWYSFQNKSLPPKNMWSAVNQAAWNALAQRVNAQRINVHGTAKSTLQSETKIKGANVTAYNMYVKEWTKKNPGKGSPPKGSWDQVPKDEVDRYQAMADAFKAEIQAQRA